MKIFLTLLFIIQTFAFPNNPCPDYFYTSGYSNDLGKMAEMVSWNNDVSVINGECGEYSIIYEKYGVYDTLLRIYQKDPDVIVINFRPTQQTSAGGDIHVDRHLVPVTFIENGRGNVHSRFQEAFLDLISDMNIDFNGKNIYMGSHSLGGAFNIFMLIYLSNKYSINPKQILSFAGPFIGDEEFTVNHQSPLKEHLGDKWWQIETINENNNQEYDGTVEGYNVYGNDFISIEYDLICGINVQPVGYGMHDMNNYRQRLIGSSCVD